MPIALPIKFKDSGKISHVDPNGIERLAAGDHVIVDTVRGPELAQAVAAPSDIAPGDIIGDLKPVIRRADDADLQRLEALNARQSATLARCAEKIREHDLPMRLVKAEYNFDGSRLTFYFTAEKRVDFRNLVRELARTFKTRIELRQIGPRDEARLLGGIGPCGRLLCCTTFLPDYARVSIKMAKDQDLPLNPAKISGVCGRLLCCLSYEHDQYVAIKAELPRKGAWVQTPDGPGEVITVNVIRETVTVELAGSGVQSEYQPAQLSEAGERVASVARSRVGEGIAPGARPPVGQRSPMPRRESRPPGERRLLRDEIPPEDADAPSHQRSSEPPAERPAAAARPAPPQPRERHQVRAAQHQRPAGVPPPASADPPPSAEGAPPALRRRRRRGRIPGQE
ncbi:MAG: stage 0 sporulation family protein [Chloroflexi bacterium]|nr:stage 0 sporulation family protein [Chloroflexota bacterium]